MIYFKNTPIAFVTSIIICSAHAETVRLSCDMKFKISEKDTSSEFTSEDSIETIVLVLSESSKAIKIEAISKNARIAFGSKEALRLENGAELVSTQTNKSDNDKWDILEERIGAPSKDWWVQRLIIDRYTGIVKFYSVASAKLISGDGACKKIDTSKRAF